MKLRGSGIIAGSVVGGFIVNVNNNEKSNSSAKIIKNRKKKARRRVKKNLIGKIVRRSVHLYYLCEAKRSSMEVSPSFWGRLEADLAIMFNPNLADSNGIVV